MKENDQVAPHHSVEVNADRNRYLLDGALRRDESIAAVGQEARCHRPNDDTDAEIRNVRAEFHPEKRTIHDTEPGDEKPEAGGDPEWSEQGPSITLPDIHPRDRKPQRPLDESVPEIRDRVTPPRAAQAGLDA